MAADEPKPEASTGTAAALGTPGPISRASERPGGAASLIGTTLSGRYKIERLLGEGGMGAVYQAEHTHMRKRLAVKVLHPEMSRLPEVVARFEREAMAAAHIDHPNVAAATDFGKLEDGSFFLALEYVEGGSLRDVVAQGRLELGRALHITRQISSGLQRAHALGIVHRDLKPENVMLVERDGDPDFVKVLDFGIAKVPVGELSRSSPEKGPILTQLGIVYGTPEYMAPEQALGQNVDARADLYSLGVMAFEMLTGSRPFDHESKVALLGMHVTAPIPRPSERAPDANIPPEVDALVIRLLAKEMTDRFQDARELTDATSAILANLAAQGRVDAHFTGPPPASLLNPLSGVGTAPTALVGVGSQGMPPGAVPSVPPPSHAAPRPSRRVMIAGTAGAATLALILGFVLVLVHGAASSKGTDTAADGGSALALGSSSPTGSSATPAVPEVEGQIHEAIALVDKGDYGTAITQLTELAQAHPGRAEIHRALVDAYMATKHPADAMVEAEKALAADATLSRDKALRLHVRNAALTGGKEAEDKAFVLLESGMGPDGPDVLYDMAYIVTGYPKPQARAKASLKKADVKAKATDELRLALEVTQVSQSAPCELKKVLDRAAELGDWRTARVLRPFLSTGGCGFLGKRDCMPCLHGDGTLSRTVKAIDERSGGTKNP